MSSKLKPFKQLLLINFSTAGREQVSVGVVPMMEAAGKGLGGAQSVLAVIPIAFANCAEKKVLLLSDLPPFCAVVPLLICAYSKYNPLYILILTPLLLYVVMVILLAQNS